MSNRRLTAELILSTIDKATAPLKKVMQSSGNTAKSLKAARETSKQLNNQLADVRKYRSARAQLRLNNTQTKKYTDQLEEANAQVQAQYKAHDNMKGYLRAAEKRYKMLVKQFEDGAGSSKELQFELEKARIRLDSMSRSVSESSSKLKQYRGKAGHANTMLKQLSRQHSEATKTLHKYRGRLDEAGIGTDKLAAKNRELQRAADGANTELKEQQARLHRLNQLQQKSQRINSNAATLAGYSGAATATGGLALRSMGGMMAPAVQAQSGGSLIAARQGQDSAQAGGYTDIINTIKAGGSQAEVAEIANALDGAASAFGRLGKTGAGELQRITSHALSLNKAFGTDTAQSIQMAQIMVKNGLAGSADEAFDLITSGMQKVTTEMRGELPDILHEYSTHFRGMGFSGEEAMSLLVQMAGQGRYALDKTGDAIKEFSIRGSDMSKASVEAYELIGLNAHKMSNAIATGGDGAQQALQATVKGLMELTDPAERANAAIALFGTPVEDLAIDQIPNFLTALGGAKDVLDETRGAADRLGGTLRDNLQGDLSKLSGSWSDLKTQLFDGETGALRSLVQQLNSTVQVVTGWARENPKLASTLVKLIAIIATIVTVMGTLGLATSTVMFGWAGLLKMAPVMGMFKALGPVLLTLGKVALPLVAGGIKAITAALIANPISIVIAAIAGLVYLIYRNWEPIKAFFAGLWDKVKSVFDVSLGSILATLVNWSPWGIFYSAIQQGLGMLGIELPATFSEFGGNMIQGLIDGITGMIPNVKEKISALGESVSGWFKGVLGINSPSRVFAEHGGDVMGGLQQGLGNGESGVMDRILGIGRNLISRGKELAGRLMSALGFDSPSAQPAMAGGGGIQFDNRPALQPRQSAGTGNSLSIGEIHIHAAPGMDEKALANLVTRKIQELHLQQAAATRSQLRDED